MFSAPLKKENRQVVIVYAMLSRGRKTIPTFF